MRVTPTTVGILGAMVGKTSRRLSVTNGPNALQCDSLAQSRLRAGAATEVYLICLRILAWNPLLHSAMLGTTTPGVPATQISFSARAFTMH
eukprot:294572-Heterocapsa_arctica.AAC.1